MKISNCFPFIFSVFKCIVINMPEEFVENYCQSANLYKLPNYYNNNIQDDVPRFAYFKWSLIVFSILASLNMACPQIWTLMEGNVISTVTSHCRGQLIGSENREKMAMDIAKYIQLFAKNNFYLMKYLLSMILVLLTITLQFHFLLRVTDLQGIFPYMSIVFNWMSEDNANRVDPLYKVFPRLIKCSITYAEPSGSLVIGTALCTSKNNESLEFMHVAAILLLVTCIASIAMDLVMLIVTLWAFNYSTNKKYRCIRSHKFLTCNQKFFCVLIEKNIDALLWNDILDQLSMTSNSNNKIY